MLKNFLRGFHLIELMIVVSIICLLTAISFPIYTEYLVKERRYEAAQLLSKAAITAEHYHFEHNGYQGMTLADLHVPTYAVKNNYKFILAIISDNDYQLTAKPMNAQAEKDRECSSLMINANGEKSVSGSANVEACW